MAFSIILLASLVSCSTSIPFIGKQKETNVIEVQEENGEVAVIPEIINEEPEVIIPEIHSAIETSKATFSSSEQVYTYVIEDMIIPEETTFEELEETTVEPQETTANEQLFEDVEITQPEPEVPPKPILEVFEQVIEEEEESTPSQEETPKTVMQTIEDTIRGEGEPKEAIVAGNVLPMWFVYTFAILFLFCLFTICYISKNRRWRRIHSD